MIQLGFIVSEPCLEQLLNPTDFHLVLPHLFKSHQKYFEFYKHCSEQGAFIMLDNSVFELEHSLNSNDLIEAAIAVKASELVAPEVLLNMTKTLHSVDRFLKLVSQSVIPFKIAAVAQGSTLNEMFECFKILTKYKEISTICIPFDIDYITPFSKNVISKSLRRVLGRFFLVSCIDSYYKKNAQFVKPIHLLGLADGLELQFQNRFAFVRSNDSSSAFLHGLFHIKYTTRGLPIEKIVTKMDFNWQLESESQRECVLYNMDMLRRFANGSSLRSAE